MSHSRVTFGSISILVLGLSLLALMSCGGSVGKPAGKLLIVALDGADWQHIDPMIERGELPTFSRLREEGASGTLLSLRGLIMSPVVWTTIATGKGPLEHGIRSYTVVDPKTGEDTQVTSTLRRSKAWWNILSEHERDVSVIGWSVTWPVEAVNGLMVSSFLPFAPEGSEEELSHLTYPDSILPEVLDLRVQPNDLSEDDLLPFLGEKLNGDELSQEERGALSVLLWSIAVDETFHRAALRYLPLERDVTAVFIGGVDKTGHHFMKYHAPEACHFRPGPQVAKPFGRVIEAYYRYADRMLADLVQAAGPETILMLVSDHGFDARPLEEIHQGCEWHRREGVLLLWGRGVRAGTALPTVSVFDIAPTILYLLGLPQAGDMRGTPVTSAFDEWVNQRSLPDPIESYQTPGWRVSDEEFIATPKGEKELELLRSLGYIR